jgi:hypothetical protein
MDGEDGYILTDDELAILWVISSVYVSVALRVFTSLRRLLTIQVKLVEVIEGHDMRMS